MLPPGIKPIAEIEQDRSPENQLTKLVSLLVYLLTKINPNVAAQDGQNLRTRERVEANGHLFTNVPDILFAIRIRNTIIHPEDRETPPTTSEIARAVKHLTNAANEIRDHYRIPAETRNEVFRPRPTPPPPPPPNPVWGQQANPLSSQTQPRMMSTESSSSSSSTAETIRHQPASAWPKHPVRWAAIFIAAALLLTYSKSLWQIGQSFVSGSKDDALVRQKEAGTTIKKMQMFSNQQGFANKVTEANSVWRDAGIAFQQERFKDAENGYQRVLQIWDDVQLTKAKYDEAQKLLAELQTGRSAARIAQASQHAPQLWLEAESARSAANIAFRNGNFAEAGQLALQAKQKYEEAIGVTPTPSPDTVVTLATPQPEPTATPAPIEVLPPTTARPTLVRRTQEQPAEGQVAREDEDDGIFLIRQREFMYYVKKQVAPILPPEARAQGISGTVSIEVVLSKTGRLSKAEAIEGHPLLRQAAINALWQWQFRPYNQDRVPIDVRSEIKISVQ